MPNRLRILFAVYHTFFPSATTGKITPNPTGPTVCRKTAFPNTYCIAWFLYSEQAQYLVDPHNLQTRQSVIYFIPGDQRGQITFRRQPCRRFPSVCSYQTENLRGVRTVKVIKRDGNIVDYDRSKIVRAIEKANAEVAPMSGCPRTASTR